MDNDELLGHLLKIEAEAIALVNDAQAEADRRVLEAEKQNHAAYDERYARENEKLENEFHQLQDNVRGQYQAELEAYRQKLSSITVNTDRFADLLDTLIAGAV
jgi:F0F1-type ATP synthase membrane subunit b/b'